MCKLIYQTQVHFLSAQIALQRVFILGMYIFEALLKRECICEIWRFAQDLCEASLNNKASSNGKKGRIFTQHYDSTYSIFIFWGSSRDEPSAQCICRTAGVSWVHHALLVKLLHLWCPGKNPSNREECESFVVLAHSLFLPRPRRCCAATAPMSTKRCIMHYHHHDL